jgi:hypothetical protein
VVQQQGLEQLRACISSSRKMCAWHAQQDGLSGTAMLCKML